MGIKLTVSMWLFKSNIWLCFFRRGICQLSNVRVDEVGGEERKSRLERGIPSVYIVTFQHRPCNVVMKNQYRLSDMQSSPTIWTVQPTSADEKPNVVRVWDFGIWVAFPLFCFVSVVIKKVCHFYSSTILDFHINVEGKNHLLSSQISPEKTSFGISLDKIFFKFIYF